ncbi:MAG: hypothetical protein M1477_04795 [Candidatus Thermoplasmatota archaeon]|nr:hypothetical protein [Candidatus Thermoplasmatota archaeon]
MTEISNYHKILFYFSNMLPTFVATAIVYFIPLKILTFYQIIYLIVILSLIVLSSIGLFWWFWYLHKLDKIRTGDEKTIKESSEISSSVSNYIIAYAVSVISVSVVGGVKGIILLAILIVLFGLYAFGWNVMLFNPFLMLKGYRLYSVELSDGSTGYIIRKIMGGPLANMKGNEMKMIMIDNYLYYVPNQN